MKTISVIVPVYNVELYLENCINSIINQTYKNLEIILVDDGSPDRCGQICDDFAQKDSRIKVIHKENGGVSAARNEGLNVATGDYVCFFDADDYIENDMLENMLSSIEDNDVCVCGYNVDFYNDFDELESTKTVIPPYAHISNQLSQSEYEFILGICGYLWNKLYKREFLQKLNFKFEEDVSLYEDLSFNANVICSGASVCFIQYAGYHYIQRKRETLGTKYYANDYELKIKALNAKCEILRSWHVEESVISKFYDNNFLDSFWGVIKNINNSNLDKKEKKLKIKNLIADNKTKLKLLKLDSKKRKRKRFLIRFLTPNLLLVIVK